MKKIGNYLFFYGGKDGIYSNWYKTKLCDIVHGIDFPNSEQAYMWHKARFFNDVKSQKLLENFNLHPREAKEIGRGISGYDELSWRAVRYGFMVLVNLDKFQDNKSLLEQLLATGNLTLVEASPVDKIWGIGLGLDTPDNILVDESKWQGQNLLGKALMEVRELLKS
jgi:ribA/ribD-fused uncharacterized protein